MFMDYITFKKMITTTIIQILFWLGVAGVVISGLIAMEESVFVGVVIIFFGVIYARVICEFIVVVFRIYDTLADIRNLLKEQNEKPKNY